MGGTQKDGLQALVPQEGAKGGRATGTNSRRSDVKKDKEKLDHRKKEGYRTVNLDKEDRRHNNRKRGGTREGWKLGGLRGGNEKDFRQKEDLGSDRTFATRCR